MQDLQVICFPKPIFLYFCSLKCKLRPMYAYITGKVAEKSPTYVVLDNQGIGYYINITLNTFTAIGENEEVRLFTHEQILEDAHNLFGFFTAKERDLFELLISVSGVGCNTEDLSSAH